jgi:hypothetical protein
MKPPPFLLAAIFLGALAGAAPPAPAETPIDRPARPAPPGPHLRKTEAAELLKRSFARRQPIVGTYYFYWYDRESGQHFVDPDGSDALTDHPEKEEGYSFRSSAWHRRELLDMIDAGLDYVLPVYWGYPGAYDEWSFNGIPPLIEASERLRVEGKAPPRIGLFYDTSTLRHNRRGFHADLTTLEGKEWLYVSARDFYSMVPPALWAAVEGRPIVWLYSASFVRRQDPAALDYLRAEFQKDFGVEPFIVKESSWRGRADAVYAWGAAINPNAIDIAALGPGYDHSAVPGRKPLVRGREGGAFYRRAWELMLSRHPASRPAIAVVETWNEFHEATEIAPTREYGRLYVELTRKHADLWRAGARVERSGPYAKAAEVRVVLGAENVSRGLVQRDYEDGKTAPAEAAGKSGRKNAGGDAGRYIYFEVDDSFFFADASSLEIEVEVFDAAAGRVVLEYDSTDAGAPHGGAFKALTLISLEGTGSWKRAKAVLEDAAFGGRANSNDFRLSVAGKELTVREVVLRRGSAVKR